MTAVLPHEITTLAYVLHIGGGTLGLASGLIAGFAPKGRTLHRVAGTVFFVSMLVMAAFASYLALAIPGQISNLFGGTFTFYIGLPEKIALFVIVCFCLPFAFLIFQMARGAAPSIKGPVVVATYIMALVVAIAAISDARVVLAGGISGARRIARHLWRMCLALTFATGSAFTNGLPRLLPGPMHVPPAFFLPMLVPLALLVFWMIRVRFTGWLPKAIALAPARL